MSGFVVRNASVSIRNLDVLSSPVGIGRYGIMASSSDVRISSVNVSDSWNTFVSAGILVSSGSGDPLPSRLLPPGAYCRR